MSEKENETKEQHETKKDLDALDFDDQNSEDLDQDQRNEWEEKKNKETEPSNSEDNQAKEDKKAKEDKGLLARLSSRIAVGGSIAKSVGRRGFERPNVAISNRIYDLYGVPDPWSPNPQSVNKWESKLGTSLKLGEAKREPGRHNMPKEPEKKVVPQQKNPVESWKPKGIPQAPKSQPKPPPPPPKPERESPFGGKKKHGIVGNIPIRPDLGASESEDANQPSILEQSSKSRRGLMKSTRVTSSGQSAKADIEQREQQRRAALLGGKTQESESKSDTGGSRRLKRTKATNRPPKITQIDQPSQEGIPSQDDNTKTESIPSQENTTKSEMPNSIESEGSRSMNSAKQPSMDDLFGGSMSKESRPKLGRRNKRT